MSGAIDVTLWRNYSRGRRSSYTWEEFIETFVADPEVSRTKRRVAGFSLGAFTDNRRLLANVEHVHALTLDCDQGDITIDRAHELLPDTRGVAYTTFSHTPEHPKLRLIYPFSRPVSAGEYERLWLWAAKKIAPKGVVLDESTRDASRFWYLPSHQPGGLYEWRRIKGRTLEVEKAMKKIVSSRPFSGPSNSPKRPVRRPEPEKGREIVPGSGAETFFGRAFIIAGLDYGVLENDALSVTCPWASSHTTGSDGDTSTVVFPATTESQWGLFHCSHAHCARRKTIDLLDVLPAGALDSARREHGAGLVRAKVRQSFVQRLEAYAGLPELTRLVLHCYPSGGRPPLIWLVKIGSPPHVLGLDGLSANAVRGRRVDLALCGRVITWGRLVQENARVVSAAE